MQNDQKLEELLMRIQWLSDESAAHQQQINQLKDEVQQLTGRTVSARPVNYFTPINEIKISAGLENFIGLKLIHFVGIIVFLIGLTIGVKYAIDVNLVTPFLRIVLAYLAAAALFLLSLRLRKQFQLFSLILFSGAMAAAYFTSFAAFEYYQMFGRTVAFIIMLLLTSFTVYNALKYDKVEIAVLGLVGAYAIPFFVGGNSGNLFALFVYMFIINSAILFISYKRYWTVLTYFAFFATWIIFLSTSIIPKSNSYLTAKVVFSFLYFALFTINAVLFKIGKKKEIDATDTFIIFINTVFLYSSLMSLFDRSNTVTPEFINLGFAIAYMIAGISLKKILPGQVHLSSTLFTLSLIALIIYTALIFSGISLTISWVLLAVVCFVLGMLFKLKVFRVLSILIFAATLIKLLLIDSSSFSAVEKIIAYLFTGTVILIISFLYQKFNKIIFGSEDPTAD